MNWKVHLRMEPKRQEELHKLYLKNMSLIKLRMRALSDVMRLARTTTYEITNIEFCVLQIRKVLELIVLSSLVSDEDLCREKMGKLEKMWNARYIIRDVERIHPDFYPHPIQINKHRDEAEPDEFVEIKEPYLTKDKLVEIYQKCGKYLHQASPFVDDNLISQTYLDAKDELIEWRALIINLLSIHVVRLYDEDYMWYVVMNEEGKAPFGNIFVRVEDDGCAGGN